MNYGELKTAVLSDSHRDDYSAHVARFIQEAEGYIAASLDGYILTDTLIEADRVDDTGVYVLGNGVTTMRYVKYNGLPLTQIDESLASQNRDISNVLHYTMRDASILISANPPVDSEFEIEWYGMPAPLENEEDTNSLLTEYPMLYRQAAQIFVFSRAENWDAAREMERRVDKLIQKINRRTRKKLGGAQSATPYNVNFRSSY